MILNEPRWKSYVVETTIPVFTPQECQYIINIGRSMPPKIGEIGAGEKLGSHAVDKGQRLSHISWIPFNKIKQMYSRLELAMLETNRNHFGFDNMQITEQAQYTEYKDGGFYGWHMDSAVNFESGNSPVRKISMSLLLNHESEFEGGELELIEKGKIAPIKQGHAIFFASFLQHRVKPVTKGLRKSLVMWFGGTPFK